MGNGIRAIGRIAPSPSGEMHLGNAFSALLAWAFARSAGGAFVVRLENLDERCQNPALAQAFSTICVGLVSIGMMILSCRPSACMRTRKLLSVSVRRRSSIPAFARVPICMLPRPHTLRCTPLYAGTCYRLDAAERDARAGNAPSCAAPACVR